MKSIRSSLRNALPFGVAPKPRLSRDLALELFAGVAAACVMLAYVQLLHDSVAHAQRMHELQQAAPVAVRAPAPRG